MREPQIGIEPMTARLAEWSESANRVVNHTLTGKQTQAETAETHPNRDKTSNELATALRTPVACVAYPVDGWPCVTVVCSDGSVWWANGNDQPEGWTESSPVPGTRRAAECDAAERGTDEWAARSVRMDLTPDEAVQVKAWRVGAWEGSREYFDLHVAGDR